MTDASDYQQNIQFACYLGYNWSLKVNITQMVHNDEELNIQFYWIRKVILDEARSSPI